MKPDTLNWIYSILKSHERVDNFRFEMAQALEFPDHHHPILVSIADSMFNRNKISKKQLLFALSLIYKTKTK